MSNPENSSHVLEKVLILFYSIDVRLNDAFKCTFASFTKSSSFFKALSKPLQTHRTNTTKIIRAAAVAEIDMNPVRESISTITAKLQFHDVIEQRLKHIRQIHNEIIQEMIAQKKSAGKKIADDSYLPAIVNVNVAQLDSLEQEFMSHCKKFDESLRAIKQYLISSSAAAHAVTASHSDQDILFAIHQNTDIQNKMMATIQAFESDLSYRQMLSKSLAEISKTLNSISSQLANTDKTAVRHPMLKRLEELYTTQGEREIFNKILFGKQSTFSAKHPDVDFF